MRGWRKTNVFRAYRKEQDGGFPALGGTERTGQDKAFVDAGGNNCYRTKIGMLKTFVAFNSFNEYQKSEYYPRKPERANGFYFVQVH